MCRDIPKWVLRRPNKRDLLDHFEFSANTNFSILNFPFCSPAHPPPCLRLTLPCGKFSITYLPHQESMFIHGSAGDKDTVAQGLTEVFSYGSGEFVKQSEAKDVA